MFHPLIKIQNEVQNLGQSVRYFMVFFSAFSCFSNYNGRKIIENEINEIIDIFTMNNIKKVGPSVPNYLAYMHTAIDR